MRQAGGWNSNRFILIVRTRYSGQHLINDIRHGPDSDKCCWESRIRKDIMTNIAWWSYHRMSSRHDSITISKAATRLGMRDDLEAFQSERDRSSSFEYRWFQVWDLEPMIREMFKATSMSRFALEERVREKRETMRMHSYMT